MISLSAAINASNGSAVKASAVKAPAVKSEGTKEEETVGADDSGAKYGDEEGDERVGQKRKRYITIVENGKKRKVVDQVGYSHQMYLPPLMYVSSPLSIPSFKRPLRD